MVASLAEWLGRATFFFLFSAVFLIQDRQEAAASEIALPTGRVILEVSGEIEHTNRGRKAVFDLAMLEAMEAVELRTETPWTEGVQTFTGVSLATLLAKVGAKLGTLRARALNDYTATLPATDATTDRALIAYRRNGVYMPVREKGPLWIVYPWSERPDLKTKAVFSRSVWHLVAIEIAAAQP